MSVRWVLVFTADNIEHLANRSIEPEDVADVAFGVHGRPLIRRAGRGLRERWLITGPVELGQLVTCVFRAAESRDIAALDAFSIPPMPLSAIELGSGVKLCVTGWASVADEVRRYKSHVRRK